MNDSQKVLVEGEGGGDNQVLRQAAGKSSKGFSDQTKVSRCDLNSIIGCLVGVSDFFSGFAIKEIKSELVENRNFRSVLLSGYSANILFV